MIKKNFSKKFLINLSIVLIIFFFDRLSKMYVIYLYKKNLVPEIFSSKFLDLTLIWNEGIGFGLLSLGNNFLYNSLTILILIIIIIAFMLINLEIKKYLLLIS